MEDKVKEIEVENRKNNTTLFYQKIGRIIKRIRAK